MTWDTGIAARIRAKGVAVIEVAGWQTRGSTSLDPVGSGNHHTAGPKYGMSPSLATCIYGRPDVAGPLCNVMQGRHPGDPMLDPAYIVAAGKANHGGKGAWRGVSGNSRFYGLEIEHTGLDTVHPDRIEVAARIQAALLEGAGRDASWLWQHYEYALPPGRKIDFAKLSPWTADSFRARVAYWIGRNAADPVVTPTPAPPEEDAVFTIQTSGQPVRLVIGGVAIGFNDTATRDRVLGAFRKAGVLTTKPVVFDIAADHNLVLDKLVTQGDLDAILRAASTTQLGESMVDVDAIRKNLGAGEGNVLRAPLADVVREAVRQAGAEA